jgi:hypothetical protein
MDEHNMLCVLGQKYRLEIERIHHHSASSKIWTGGCSLPRRPCGGLLLLPVPLLTPIAARGLSLLRLAIRRL